jgi:predicted metal-dependent HD superfamily phosphohydrolase
MMPEGKSPESLSAEIQFSPIREFYNPQLPYHNFDHVMATYAAAKRIIGHCLQENISVDETVVEFAVLFHDAGYDKDYKHEGFASREAYATFLAEEVLSDRKIPESTIQKVKETILATRQQGEFTNVEQKIVRAADLDNMAGSYEEFRRNNLLLKQEAEMLGGKKITWSDWKRGTKNVIEYYLSQEIHLTKNYADEQGRSVFHTKTRENLERFLTDSDIEKE